LDFRIVTAVVALFGSESHNYASSGRGFVRGRHPGPRNQEVVRCCFDDDGSEPTTKNFIGRKHDETTDPTGSAVDFCNDTNTDPQEEPRKSGLLPGSWNRRV
jgi:hypothetical protein